MVCQEIRDQLPEDGVVFDNSSFDRSIIGYSTDGAVIYSYEKMVDEYIEENQCSEEDAMEWIDYNVIRSIPYAARYGTPPIVMYSLM